MMIRIFQNTKYTFDGQRDGEIVSLFLNRYWIVVGYKLLFLFAAIFFPVIPIFVFSGLILEYHLENLSLFILTIYFLFIWFMAFYSITMFFLDSWIVTDTRVLDMTQHGFFSRTVSEMHLAKVQDISVKVSGFIPTLFGYGDVEIQSAGTVEKFVFREVKDPNKVRERIMALADQAREKEVNL